MNLVKFKRVTIENFRYTIDENTDSYSINKLLIEKKIILIYSDIF